MPEFTPASLVAAIRTLFELNHYEVTGPLQIHGAEVDLLATPQSDPFRAPIYVEVTVEYVDNDKYGRDVGKLAMIGELEPAAQRLIVSSAGFSLPVQERAKATRITTLTYAELFRRFERFDKYLDAFRLDTERGRDLATFNSLYEEPLLDDVLGKDVATQYLTKWRDDQDPKARWLVITGEYGTGKTALTRILQYRWLQEYETNPALPIPFRVELRDFSRQFDARGLLHHFLDANSLGHVPIDFVLSLIRDGRVVLLLDGYDEMAQYLHARERRACLEALAELSSGGAKGILTSRPNYFTEAEELQVFEVLYAALQHGKYHLTAADQALLEREARIDQLLLKFIERFERTLKDLTPEQTEALISRVLAADAAGRDVVLAILRRIFRTLQQGDAIALSGKPVIISYLLQVVEELKRDTATSGANGSLTEWQVYKLIVDQLMLRDLRRSPEINPQERRQFLRRVAVFLSKRGNPLVHEPDFKDLIAREFRRDLARLAADTRVGQIERLFSDLRTSATLTRARDASREGWRFSHNSLREYLVTEHLLNGLENGQIVDEDIPISDAMRLFAASRNETESRDSITQLASAWRRTTSRHGRGQLLSLLWDGCLKLFAQEPDYRRKCLEAVCGAPVVLRDIDISRLALSSTHIPTDLSSASFVESGLYQVAFSGARLHDADFSNATLEEVHFDSASLRNTGFRSAILIDVDFAEADVAEADFTGVDPHYVSILVENDNAPLFRSRYEGLNALGYLSFHGAITDTLPDAVVLRHHPKFPIAEKILEKLSEQTVRQRHGLEQRGEARSDMPFAKRFMKYLTSQGIIKQPKARKGLVEVTEQGRDVLSRFTQTRELPIELVVFFRDEK